MARRALVTPLLIAAGFCAVVQSAGAAQTFPTSPNAPNLPGLTLNGQAQTLTAQMANWAVNDSQALFSNGWNVTVNGRTGSGLSPVFKVWCPGPSACGGDAAGYVTGGSTLAANSLVLNSTGATFTGGLGTTPTHSCNAGCNVDSAAPVKVASEGSAIVGIGTWTTSGYSATSLTLSVPTTIRIPLQAGEIYHVDLVWTLSSGP
jgi:hypothetical protein